MSPTDPSPPVGERALTRFVAWWTLIGLGVLVVVVLVVGVRGPVVAPLAFVAVVLATAVATSLPLEIHLGERQLSVDLTEVAIVVGVAIVPLRAILAAVVIGSALALLLVRRVDAQKLAFNLGVTSAAVGVVVLVLAAFEVEPLDATRGDHVLVLSAAMFGYGLVYVAATVGLWRRLSMRIVGGLRGFVGTSLLGTGLGTGLALLAVGTATAAPVLLPVLVVLVALVGWSLRQQVARLDTDLQAHARLERVVAGASDGIGLLDPRGRLELANPAMRRLLHLDVSGHGERFTDIVAELPDASSDVAGDAARRIADALHALDVETPERRVEVVLDERTIAIELTATFGADEVQTGVVVLAFDVTTAREAEAVRAELVARVSHELRTPLTSIVGFVETMEHRGAVLAEDERRRYLAIIARQTRRLQRLVGTLLWSARIDAGLAGRTEPETIDLRRLVVETLTALPPPTSGAPETVDVPAELQLLADADHVTQILENLVLNARTYGEPPIRVRGSVVGDDVLLEVSDGGPGVSAAFEAELFRPFQQASSGDRRTATGLGLGLSIVQALAEVNHGRVRFVRHGGRSCFEVRFPRSVATSETGGARTDADDGAGRWSVSVPGQPTARRGSR